MIYICLLLGNKAKSYQVGFGFSKGLPIPNFPTRGLFFLL